MTNKNKRIIHYIEYVHRRRFEIEPPVELEVADAMGISELQDLPLENETEDYLYYDVRKRRINP
jgi:hypothetical protein